MQRGAGAFNRGVHELTSAVHKQALPDGLWQWPSSLPLSYSWRCIT